MSDAIEQITLGVKLMREYDKKISAYEQNIKLLRAARLKISAKELPALYEKLGGLTELKVELEDGEEYLVSKKMVIHAALSKGHKSEVFGWMRDNEYDHHIQSDVVVPFTKGQEEALAKFVDYLEKAPDHVDYNVDDAVHSSTYTSFVKGIVSEGYHIDDDMFGVHRFEEVEITAIVDGKKKPKRK